MYACFMFYCLASSVNGGGQADDGAILLMKLNAAVNTCRMNGEEESAQARYAILTGMTRRERVGATSLDLPVQHAGNRLIEFATAEAETWGMDLRQAQSNGSDMELVLKSPSVASGVLARNVWGEPVVGATTAALENSASTLFPLNCSASISGLLDDATRDQLCLQVPIGSPLFYARQTQARVLRAPPNAILNVNKLGVVSLVALESPIAAGTPLSVAPPIVAPNTTISPGNAPGALANRVVADGEEVEPQPFLMHMRMYKVSIVINPALLVLLCIHTSKFRPVSSLLAYRLYMWDPMVLIPKLL